MAFGIPGITAPAQTAAANPIPALNRADPTAGTPAAKPTPMDTVTRSDATTKFNAYHDAIAKFSGGSGPTTHAATASHTATTHATTTTHPTATHTQATSVSSTDQSMKPNQTVASMSLAAKVSATTRAGIANAAQDAAGSLKTALSDPKKQAMLAGGAAVVAGAQFVPGLDVAVDATLGTAGAAMYISASSEHQANIAQAYAKFKDYVGEVGSAKTQADLDKASTDFAGFVKLGGSEAIDAAGTLAGGAAAAGKLASGVKAAGAIEGAKAAVSSIAGNVGDALNSAADSVTQALSGHPPLAYDHALASSTKGGLSAAADFASASRATHIPGGAAGALANGANAAGGAAVAPGKASATTGESAKPATAPGSTTETTKTGTKTANRSANLPSALKTDSSRARNELVKNGDPVDRKVTKLLSSAEWRAHHLIPVKAVQDNQLLFTKASNVPGGFKTDESANLTALPDSAAAQETLKRNGVDRPVHNSGHAKTIDDVDDRLNTVKDILSEEGLTPSSPGYGQRANELIRGVEEELRQELPSTGRLTYNVSPTPTNQRT